MKKQIIFLITTFLAIDAKAQGGYNDNDFGIGVGTSLVRGYTNLKKQNNQMAFNINLIYNAVPYLPVVAEFQMGRLSGGGLLPSQDRDGRTYVNNYKAIIFHGDFQLEQGMKSAGINYENSWVLQIVKDCYLGSGIGIVFNNNTVQRYSIYTPPYPQPGYYKFPGTDKSTNISLPLRFGYEFKIYDNNYSYSEPSMAIDIGYVHSIVYGSGLDGYNDPRNIFRHLHECQYRQIAIVFKYYFGNNGGF